MTGLRMICIALALLLAAAGVRAAPQDLAGWQGARWGMTEAELAEVFGAELARLPGRWDFGGAYAERALMEAELGGLDFMAFFQMNKRSHELQQVLLERRDLGATPAAYDRVLSALVVAYGPPEGSCMVPHPDGPPRRVSLRWRFPTTTVQVTWLDFLTTAIVSENPNVDPDPLVPYLETRRNNRRFLPRRILVRFHPSERQDLQGWADCAGEAGGGS